MCAVAVVGGKLDHNADVIRYIWHWDLDVKGGKVPSDLMFVVQIQSMKRLYICKTYNYSVCIASAGSAVLESN